jgi:hypothetical protein
MPLRSAPDEAAVEDFCGRVRTLLGDPAGLPGVYRLYWAQASAERFGLSPAEDRSHWSEGGCA